MTIKEIIDPEYINFIVCQYPFFLDDLKFSHLIYKFNFIYAGEIRFGPPYFAVQLTENGIKKWEKSMFGGELFRENIFSSNNKIILVRWHSLSPNDETIVEIDIDSGEEKEISKKSRYYFAGHMYSFNAIYYSESGVDDIVCKDLETNETFPIKETLRKYINNFKNWGISPINDSIIILAKKENYHTIILFDMKRKKNYYGT